MIAKKHIARIEQMVRRAEEKEARLQEMFGDRRAGTIRSTDWRDAEALRAVLAYLNEGDDAPKPGKPWTDEQIASLRAWAKNGDEEATLRRAEEIKAERLAKDAL